MTDCNAIIIATGEAAPSLAHRLAGAGLRVAFVERNRFGGTSARGALARELVIGLTAFLTVVDLFATRPSCPRWCVTIR